MRGLEPLYFGFQKAAEKVKTMHSNAQVSEVTISRVVLIMVLIVALEIEGGAARTMLQMLQRIRVMMAVNQRKRPILAVFEV